MSEYKADLNITFDTMRTIPPRWFDVMSNYLDSR